MVQIIDEGPTAAQRFAQGLASGSRNMVSEFGEIIRQKKLQDKEEQNQKQQQQQVAQALQAAGLDPRIASLPKELQLEILKSKLPQKTKPLTELQQSQKNLADARLKGVEEENRLFNQYLGNPDQQTKTNTPKLNIPGITKLNEDSDQKEEGQNEVTSDPKTWSENTLKNLSSYAGKPGAKGILGNKADQELKRREKKEKTDLTTFQKDRDYHSQVSRPIIQAANERLKTSDVNKGIREQLKRDIASGETSGFGPYMVDKLGLESFRNPESARFSNEVKNIFVGSLNEIPGARPNMFIERMLSTAQPLIGRSPEANLSVLDVADFVEDLRDEQAKKELEIAKEDREKFDYVKEDVSERARERMGDYANRKQEEMALKIQERHESGLDNTELINELLSGKTTPGSYVTPKIMRILYIKNDKDMKKAVSEAESLNLKFPEYLE